MKKPKTQKQKFLDTKFNIALAAAFAIFIGSILYVPALEYAKKRPTQMLVRYELYKPNTTKNIFVPEYSFNHADELGGLNDQLDVVEAPVGEEVQVVIDSSAPVLTRDLRLGDVHPEVKVLQKYLNDNGFLVAESGPGSPGQETERFGSATEQAVIRFQEAYADILLKPVGLNKGTGVVGELTRGFINS